MTLVFDNNVVISAALNSASITYNALEKGLVFHRVIRSDSTFKELTTTIHKSKFDRVFFLSGSKSLFIFILGRTTVQVIKHSVEICRDPKDDIYLELALSGKADLIISGDHDLLVLNPFQGISILTPSEFLKHH